jgi:RNA polymerase sigma-70 factor (ECF subfamily)
MGAKFATTQWSVVLAVRDGAETEAHRALTALCEAYWSPLYSYVRSRGHTPEQALDLTQGYFAYLLEDEILQKVEPSAGRFRSYLLASLKHYVAHEHRKERALKRGGGVITVSLDAQNAEYRYSLEPTDRLTPEQVFEHRWALTVLERALSRLEDERADIGKHQQFALLQPHLTGQQPRVPFQQVALALDMTETAVRGAMYRLRQRYGQLIREEVAETIAEPDGVDDEVRHLLAVIGPWESKQA